MAGVLPVQIGRPLRFSVPFILALQTFTALKGLDGNQIAMSVGLFVVAAGAWCVVPWRREGDLLDQALLVASIGAGAGLMVSTGAGQVYVTGYGALFVAPFWYGVPEAIGPWLAGVAGIGLSTSFVGKVDLIGGVGNAIGAAFFGLAALFWGQVMRTARENEVLIDELRASREAERINAAAAERSRLARELHDVLAHTLSSLSLHLESTRALARSRDVDQEVAQRIEQAVSLARTGLSEARTAVGTLRDDDLPGPERIAGLVDQFAVSSGVACRFSTFGEPRPLTPQARVALFRTAQEGLSNIAKHSAASRVEVVLDWRGQDVTLRVDDVADSPPSDPPSVATSGGNGLRGMRERAELAGGRMSAMATDSGFSLTVSLPA